MDIVASAPRPAIFSSYSSSLQDLRSLANALPRDPLYAASLFYPSDVLPLRASTDADDLSSPPPLSFAQRMPPQSLQRFDSSRVVSDSTATSTAAQASQPSPPTGDSSQQASYVPQQAHHPPSPFPQPASFSRMQVASFNSSTAFPPSPHSAYSNSPNTPHGFGHASPAVASPALDSRMIQQGSYISSYGHAQSYGTPVTAQFPVPGGCTPHEQPQQHGFYAGPNASPASHHGAFHRKSSSAGSSASLSDALGLYPHAAYGSMAANDASGVTHSPTMFGSPRFAEPQADHLVRRPSTGPRRSSLGFSPKLARSPFQLPSNTLVSSSPRATMTSPSSDHVVIPPGQSPHIQNYALLPQGVRTDGISTGSPSHSPRISFSAPTSPPAITPPSGVGLGLTSPRPHSITIARPKALRKPKKQLPVPEPGLVKASRGRAVPTQVELLDSGVWDGDITAAHNKARIRERVKMRQSARAAVQGDGAPATPADGNASGGSVVTRDAAWDGRDRGDGDAAGGDADREGSLASNAGQAWSGGEGYSLSASPELASLGAAQGHEAMPTVHVVSPRSYVCPVPSCSKAFKRREHLRRHLRSIHTNDKPHKCPHPGCTKSFSRTDNLWQHVKTHEATSSGYRTDSETGIDAQPGGHDSGTGWQDDLTGAVGATPLLHNPSMLDASSSTGLIAGGGYPQYAPLHYEYSDVRQQPEPVHQHPHFVQHGMASHHLSPQQQLWGNLPQASSSTFPPNSTYNASGVSLPKLYDDDGQQQPYPHGRL